MATTKIKVLFILHSSTVYTGSNKSIFFLLKELNKKNIEPIIIMPQRTEKEMSLYYILTNLGFKCETVRYYMPLWPSFDTIRDKLFFLYRLFFIFISNKIAFQFLRKIVAKENIDLIHTNVGPLLLGHKLSRAVNKPHVWHIREYQDLDFSMKPFYSKKRFISYLNSRNTYPIAISKSVYQYFEMSPPAKIIYNGILSKNHLKKSIAKDDYLLFVGYLRQEKGIEDLLEVFNTFTQSNDNIKLLVAGSTGDSDYLSKLNKYVSEKGLHNRVSFLGNRDDVYELMMKARALIVPSQNEAFGRVTVEAMFNGCFVIGKNTSGTKEIIEKIGIGRLYDTNEELLNAMHEVVERSKDYSLSNLDGISSKIIQYFSIEENAESIYRLYSEILRVEIIKKD